MTPRTKPADGRESRGAARTPIAWIVVIAVLLVACADRPSDARAGATVEYYCPMHPHIVAAEPGECPICGMDLAERETSAPGEGESPPRPPSSRSGESPPGGREVPAPPLEVGAVTLSAGAVAAAGLTTVRAERMPLRREIRAAGAIEADETRMTRIAARVPGRLERLYLDFTGQKVRRGDPVYAIYSPDLVTAQRELLLALGNVARAREAGSAPYVASAESLLGASRDRLRLWGIGDEQIGTLELDREVQTVLVVHSPVAGTVLEKHAVTGQYVTAGEDLYVLADLSRVWLQARVYDYELGGVRLGQEATVTLEGSPGRELRGTVTFIDPVIDPVTRTARVRIELPNPAGAVKPGAFADADLRVDLGTRLALPRGALLDTGTRQVVYVKTGESRFVAREVRAGERAGDWVEIAEGLQEGEEVVAAASFLVDSQSQLLTGASIRWGGASEMQSTLPSLTPSSRPDVDGPRR